MLLSKGSHTGAQRNTPSPLLPMVCSCSACVSMASKSCSAGSGKSGKTGMTVKWKVGWAGHEQER